LSGDENREDNLQDTRDSEEQVGFDSPEIHKEEIEETSSTDNLVVDDSENSQSVPSNLSLLSSLPSDKAIKIQKKQRISDEFLKMDIDTQEEIEGQKQEIGDQESKNNNEQEVSPDQEKKSKEGKKLKEDLALQELQELKGLKGIKGSFKDKSKGQENNVGQETKAQPTDFEVSKQFADSLVQKILKDATEHVLDSYKIPKAPELKIEEEELNSPEQPNEPEQIIESEKTKEQEQIKEAEEIKEPENQGEEEEKEGEIEKEGKEELEENTSILDDSDAALSVHSMSSFPSMNFNDGNIDTLFFKHLTNLTQRLIEKGRALRDSFPASTQSFPLMKPFFEDLQELSNQMNDFEDVEEYTKNLGQILFLFQEIRFFSFLFFSKKKKKN